MKNILNVRLGTALTHVLFASLLLFILSPLVFAHIGHEFLLEVGAKTAYLSFIVFVGCFYASGNYKKLERLMYPLLFTVVAHVLFIFGSASLLSGLGDPIKNLDELTGLLGLIMWIVAANEWCKIFYPEEFAPAGSNSVIEKRTEVAEQQV